MKYLDLTLPSPEENLACDEWLLDLSEASEGPELLRFWESQTYFVAIGYANHVSAEAYSEICQGEGIPILRRCSGGGTVLQGPGCLNYSLILSSERHIALKSISKSNEFIMEKHRNALQSLLSLPVDLQGHTDLAVRNLKFSGNAQRRKRVFLLFHGTFLLNFDLPKIDLFLRHPSKEPPYRQQRSHKDFLTNLNVEAEQVKTALRSAWGANEDFGQAPAEAIRALAKDKYSTNEWNFKF